MDDGVSQSAERRASAILGRTIAGKFHVESYVGGGAMGAVYRARQIALDKDVAVKVLHGEHAGDATFAARFQREAKAASKLDHPNSMRVIDFGQEPDGLLYIAMEFLDGRDLFHVIREDWPLSAARVADIVSQALAALAVAHDMGIVHRDLKPENIMILQGTDDEGQTRDIVKVCDFGIAKFTEPREAHGGGQKLTSQGIVVGTPEYMSPEQGKGEALDARSDLYAMGVILYQLLTGRVPFDAETALGVVLKHVTEDPVPPRQTNPTADERLEAICLRAMRKKRDDRYPSAREMRQDLRVVLGATDPLAHAATVELPATGLALGSSQRVAAVTASKMTPPGTVTDSGEHRTSRGRGVLVTLAVLAVAAGAVATWTLRTRGWHRPAAPPVTESVRAATVAPSTSIEPLRLPNAELPPLEPPRATGAKTSNAAASRTTAGTHATASVVAESESSASPLLAPPGTSASTVPPVASSPSANAPSVPAGPPFDASRAHVDWSVAASGGGASAGAVQRALSHKSGAWTQCYRNGLEHRNERIDGAGVLHIVIDDLGNVVGTQMRGFEAMPGVKNCIASNARVHVDGVDSPDAWADVQLNFRAE